MINDSNQVRGASNATKKTRFTTEQGRAIAARVDVDACLLAPPGSGKTRTAAGRVAYLIKKGGLSTRNIVCVTYTESAAANLKGRILTLIREKCGPDMLGLADLQIGTFHKIALEWLRRFVPAYSQHRVLTEAQRRLLTRRYFTEIGIGRVERIEGRGKRTKTYYLTEDPNDVRLFLDASDLIRGERIAPARLPVGLRGAYQGYLRLLDEKRLFDYAQILTETHAALCDAEGNSARLALQKYVSETVKQMLVDEMQDCAPILVSILSRIRTLGARLWAVGDVRQAIMGFQGGHPRSLADFTRRYQGAESFALTESFRLSPTIADAAASLLPDMGVGSLTEDADAGRIYAVGHHCSEYGDLAAVVLPSVGEQDNWGAKRFRALHGTPFIHERDDAPMGLHWSDMAVLVRRRETARRVAAALRDQGIPVYLHGAEHLLESDEANAIAVLYENLSGKASVDAVRAAFGKANIGIDGDKVNIGITHLDGVRAEAEAEPGKPVCLIRILYDALGAMGFEERRIPYHAGGESENGGPGRRELVMHNIARVTRAAQDYQDVNHLLAPATLKFADFAGWLRHQAPIDYADSGGSGTSSDLVGGVVPDAVHVLTLHRAKATEYPVVWIPDVSDGELPIATWPQKAPIWQLLSHKTVRASHRFDGTQAEETRLFFVGVTRAMRYLFLTAPAALPKGERLLPPSPLLKHMQARTDFVTDPSIQPRVATEEKQTAPHRQHAHGSADGQLSGAITQTPSELFVFFNCPYQWRLRVGFGFPPPAVETMGHPDSIHSAIREYHERVLRGELPTGNAMSDTELGELSEELVARHHHAPFAPNKLRPILRAAALRKVGSYIREYGNRDVSLGETVESVEQSILASVSGVNVVGRYDVSSIDAEGRPILDDLKTSPAAVRRDPDLLVARAYALGYEALTGRLPVRVGTRAVGASAENYRFLEMDEVIAEDMRLRIIDAGRAISLNVLPARPAEGRRTCAGCDPAALCFNSRRYKARSG